MYKYSYVEVTIRDSMGVVSRLTRYAINILKLFTLIGLLTVFILGTAVNSTHTQPTIKSTDIFQQTGEGSTGDLDNDGLTNYNETYRYSTNKTNPDTDNDGLTDYEEIHTHGTWPTHPHTVTPIYTDGELHTLGINLQTGLQQPATNQSHSIPYIHYTDIHTQLQTQPGTHDTDGDGLTDTYEQSKDAFSPTQKDVIINVYIAQNTTVPIRTFIESAHMFSTLPTTTTNTSGIQLHFVIHDTPPLKRPNFKHTNRDQLIYNMNPPLYSPTTQNTHTTQYRPYTILYKPHIHFMNASGVAMSDKQFTVIETQSTTISRTTVHELGHLFGLLPDEFHGIDSRDLSSTEYPSIMNYNYKQTPEYNNVQSQKFSSQPPYNDIHIIETTLEQRHNVSVYAG